MERGGMKGSKNWQGENSGWGAVLFIHGPREKNFERKKDWGKDKSVSDESRPGRYYLGIHRNLRG